MRNLQEMAVLRRKFTIDDDLKRYEKALTSLYNLDVFEEFKQYTVKNELYSHGIELYRYQRDKLNELMRLYADFLSRQRSFKKAGIGKRILVNGTDYELTKIKRMNIWGTMKPPFSLTDKPTYGAKRYIVQNCQNGNQKRSKPWRVN